MRQYIVKRRAGLIDSEPEALPSWDPRKFLSDPRGLRLIEEVVRRLRELIPKLETQPEAVALSLPGTLEGTSICSGSSRLGIYETVDVSDEAKRLGGPTCYLFHDAECLAIGEVRHGISESAG